MKIRKKEYGDCNMVGANIELLRKKKGICQKDFIKMIQLAGYDMNPSSYSKLEGQLKVATDKELFAISKVLGITIDELFKQN